MGTKQPSKLELAMLSLLWERGAMTARDVLEALPDGKRRAYTSVLSVLQAMERKGLVRHTARANTNVYHAVAERDATLGQTLRELVRDVFGGSPATAMQHLLHETEVNEADLEAMERLVAQCREERGDAS